jgi:hypothetical protein
MLIEHMFVALVCLVHILKKLHYLLHRIILNAVDIINGGG